MLSNCSLWHKLQQSHGDLQSLSMSSESFNPGQTQQAHQQERVSAKKAKHVTMERVRQRQREILQLLLASGGWRCWNIFILFGDIYFNSYVDVLN